MLKFSAANAKIEALQSVDSLQYYFTDNRKVYSLDLLSGHSCPFAELCLSKVVIENAKRKIQDGLNTQFRCFSASQEVAYTNTYNLRNHNFTALRACKNDVNAMVELIESSMPRDLGVCRIHVAGDFFSFNYMMAWHIVASHNPNRLFYAYTKSLPYLVRLNNRLPNFVITASYGGRHDRMIDDYKLRYAKVVYSVKEANDLGLEIDHDDSHAADPTKRDQSFALLIHGIQPKGSDASVAVRELKGLGSYSRK